MAEQDKILIIEDDPDIAELVEINVRDIGYELVKEKNGREGLENARKNS